MINFEKMKKMLEYGSKNLQSEYLYINDLNVFPVPDGDTGSNMNTTVSGAIDFLNDKEIKNFHDLASNFTYGLLMNARGNSGVILSQIFRGFFNIVNSNTNEIGIEELKIAFKNAKDQAYKSVSNPVEGTILTVIREISEQVKDKKFSNIEDMFKFVCEIGNSTVVKTKDILPELKQVGVVDSGAYGLMSFFNGMNKFLIGEEIVLNNNNITAENKNIPNIQINEEEGFGYCSEIILKIGGVINPNNKNDLKENFNFSSFKKQLSKIGNSMVCVHDNDLVKVHIHTFKPYMLLKIAQKYGEFEKIKIENMTKQYLEKHKTKFKEGNGIIVTAPTPELANLFQNDYQVDKVIVTEGNPPSVKVFHNAINELALKNIFLILDDSNFKLAAQEAINLVKHNVNIEIILTKNIFDSLLAISSFDKSASFKINSKYMNKAVKKSLSAMISTASKNVEYSHITVKTKNKIGIVNKKIISANNKAIVVLEETLDALMNNQKNIDICYLICGVNSSNSVIKQFEKYAFEKYGLYCEIKYGGQKVYDYYLGVQ